MQGFSAPRRATRLTQHRYTAGKQVMADTTMLEQEVARLIVDALNLEDVKPESIDPEAPLFREGLGLDSIDALELALAISKKYGFRLQSDDKQNSEIFRSLRALSRHIEQNRVA
jgi:acyl carrier protein